MTGYASAQHSTAKTNPESESKAAPASQLGLEIRSVNSRFLESTTQGAVQDPSPRLLQRLNAVQDSVKAWLPDAAPLSVADIIRLAATDSSCSRDWSDAVMPLGQQALEALLSARQREGERLATMLLERIGQLRTLANQAVPLVPQLVAHGRHHPARSGPGPRFVGSHCFRHSH